MQHHVYHTTVCSKLLTGAQDIMMMHTSPVHYGLSNVIKEIKMLQKFAKVKHYFLLIFERKELNSFTKFYNTYFVNKKVIDKKPEGLVQ